MTGSSSSKEKVVIVGGAVVGSFVAYFLQEMGFSGQIQIVERDPTYRFSSTALSAASIRTPIRVPRQCQDEPLRR